ncbi:sigma-54-dependent transcriptional regulator [Bdellovibrio sp. HCB337]|uniref:sigma-54-dependent transcriptional regulator n=1 Tax=Bdellovibrio sp. HCB337 TaxID=3394358 RepID=UPI0039A6EEB2
MKTNRAFHLLAVDDDPLIHQSLKLCVSAPWKVISVSKKELVPYTTFFHAAMVDMHLTPGSRDPEGVKVIERLMKHNPQLEVVAMSGDLDRDLMEQCLKAGAQRFLAKPLQAEEVMLVLNKIDAYWSIRNLDPQGKDINWIGSGPSSQKIKKRIAELKGETKTILIEGETGCGKEVAARLLNQQEDARPFISVNISSIPENLFESELFGHVKGSFTGADQNKMGLAEAAHGGDLFLDEIEALPLTQQVKLLRFLESGEVRKVGSKESFNVQTRVIIASNQPIKRLVSEGKFREDLYFRLSSQRIELPPLRDRKEDIPDLARNFLEQERPRRNKQFTDDGLAALDNYVWPGNVRELKRVCEQISLTSPLPFIRGEDVDNLLYPDAPKRGRTNSTNMNFTNVDFTKGLGFLVEEFEANLIRACLKKYPDVGEASEVFKVSRSNLYKKIKDYKIDEENL